MSVGKGIAIAGVWVALAAIASASLPFAVLIIPLNVPVAAVVGGIVVTPLILGRITESPRDGTETGP
jgi:hypothetical protein